MNSSPCQMCYIHGKQYSGECKSTCDYAILVQSIRDAVEELENSPWSSAASVIRHHCNIDWRQK